MDDEFFEFEDEVDGGCGNWACDLCYTYEWDESEEEVE